MMTTSLDRLHAPDWVRDAIFYQIFPDRFRQGNKSWDVDPCAPADRRLCCGNLDGIRESIPYLEDLGINAIYLTPIFHAGSYHKYDTLDYFAIDPSFGSNHQFRALVDALHQRGIRIMLDGVFNHCSDRHPFFLDVVNHGPASEYWDWFTIDGERVISEPETNYVCWAGVKSMPEWNHRNPRVHDYLLSVVRHWIAEYGIDGWRLDTTEYLPPDFVKDIRKVSKQENPDTYVLGEVMGLATSWFKHDAIDGTMHYKLWEGLVSFLATREWDAEQFATHVRGIWKSYPDEANYDSYTLLGSHDKARFLTLCDRDYGRLTLAMAFLFTFPGAPAIYYGDEIGLQGGDDPDNRRCFPWDESDWNHPLRDEVRRLIRLRKDEEALRHGGMRILHAGGRILSYQRSLRDQKLVVMINAHHHDDGSLTLPDGRWQDVITRESVNRDQKIPPLSYRVYQRIASISSAA